MAKESNTKSLNALNRVQSVGIIASAMTSREGVLGRRLEIPAPDARELIEIVCEKGEFSEVFRGLRVDQWVEVEGRLRRRSWRDRARMASRT
jgi:hypothetical protein